MYVSPVHNCSPHIPRKLITEEQSFMTISTMLYKCLHFIYESGSLFEHHWIRTKYIRNRTKIMVQFCVIVFYDLSTEKKILKNDAAKPSNTLMIKEKWNAVMFYPLPSIIYTSPMYVAMRALAHRRTLATRKEI